MPKFDWKCEECGQVWEVGLKFDQVDLVKAIVCECGGSANRLPHYASTRTNIPAAFIATTGQGIGLPRNKAEEKRWEEDGVRKIDKCDF